MCAPIIIAVSLDWLAVGSSPRVIRPVFRGRDKSNRQVGTKRDLAGDEFEPDPDHARIADLRGLSLSWGSE
jgi:hypothetical protein